MNASASLFRVLGVKAPMGRMFSEADDQFGAPKVALLSEAFWRDAFGTDPAALGRAIRLNQEPYTIIGVMPRGFQFPSPQTQVWIPLAAPRKRSRLRGGPKSGCTWLRGLPLGRSKRPNRRSRS